MVNAAAATTTRVSSAGIIRETQASPALHLIIEWNTGMLLGNESTVTAVVASAAAAAALAIVHATTTFLVVFLLLGTAAATTAGIASKVLLFLVLHIFH